MRTIFTGIFLLCCFSVFSQVPDYIYKGVDVAEVKEIRKSGGRIKAEAYSKEGKLLLEAYFRKNRETGRWKKYRPDGNLYYTYSFRKGKQHGWYRYYNETGRLGYKQRYMLGTRYGKYRSYHPNGRLNCKAYYRPVQFLRYDFIVTLPENFSLDPRPGVSSVKVGKETCYYESGKVRIRKYYDFNYIKEFDWVGADSETNNEGYFEIRDVEVKTGKWLYFNEKGKIIRTEDYDKNKLVRTESIKED